MSDIPRSTNYWLRIAACALLLTVLGGGAAVAFTAAPGFTASTYAGGVTPGTSVAGVAFTAGSVYAVDPSDGILYRGTGTTPIALSAFATLGGGPTGIAASGAALYVARNSANDIVRVDATAGTWSSIASIACPNGIATDPGSGDLFVSSCTSIYRVSAPGSTAAVTRYADVVPGGFATYGIAFSSDGWIYTVALGNSTIYRVAGPAPTTSLTPGAIATVPGARGVAAVAQYLFVSSSDGSITKLPIPELAQAQVAALTAGDPGDLDAIGPDGCVYAAQGAAIVRLGDAAGSCDLAAAAPPPPPPSLSLQRISTGIALVGGGDQTFTATLANAPSLGGVDVTFTVSGANSDSAVERTQPNGIAGFAYAATATGVDTIVATAVVNGRTVTSNAVTLDWPRTIDTAAPTITYAVAGTPGESFGCPRSDIGTPGVTEYCGWYTTAPTLTWTVAANGASGIDWSRTSCPPFTLVGGSPATGTPVTCIAYNGDGASAALQVRLQATAGPPSVTASATTSDGAPYVAGTPTPLPVTVTFACDTWIGAAGVVGCDAPVTVSTIGSHIVTGSVVDVAGTKRSTTFAVNIVTTQITKTTIVSAPFVATGGSVSAKLVTAGGIGLAGRTLTFTAGGASAAGITDTTGVASVSLPLVAGDYTLTASFAGDGASFASSATQPLTVYEMTRFVVWGPRATLGARVQLYGDDWAMQIADAAARKVFDRFKGYAASATATSWTGAPGDSAKAPRAIGRYVGVLVTTRAVRSGSTLTGDVSRVVIVRVDGDGSHPYDGRVGERVFGTVVGAP